MFIFLERDSFEANSRDAGEAMRDNQFDTALYDRSEIRRPYRGIQIKNDTYAMLSVRLPNNRPIKLTSGASKVSSDGIGKVTDYSDFILQQVTDQRMEKQQIIETFGDSFVYFFGERPRIITLSGMLLNTEDFNWRAQFWYNYDKYIRGSKLVQLNARCYIAYDTIVLEGYPLSATAVDDADSPYSVSFQMTMLMTDYHEYSTIGSIRFPSPPETKSLDVLNQELADKRGQFVSSTIEVRAHNLHSSSSNQIPQTNSALALLRAGVSAWNEGVTAVSDALASANRLLSGRVMRVPVGAASFLQLSQEGELAASSANVVTTAFTNFDLATAGRFGSIVVNGQTIPGNKLQVMGPAKYAPIWQSAQGGMPPGRGFIHENYDEYPYFLKGSRENSTLQELVTESQYAAIMTAAEKRAAKMTAYQESLVLYNIAAAAGGWLEAIGNVVSAARSGYGMLMTAANFVRDPLGTATAALGVTPQDIARIGEGLKDGAFIPGVSWFVGGAARKTWEGWVNDVEDRYSAGIGGVFDGFEYDSNVATRPDDRNYDLAYGDSDYTAFVDRREAAALAEEDANLTEQEERERAVQLLDETYGNVDANYGEGREDAETLNNVYGGEGTITKTPYKAEERARLLAQAQATDAPVNDTDTSGITAADADSAPINPVA